MASVAIGDPWAKANGQAIRFCRWHHVILHCVFIALESWPASASRFAPSKRCWIRLLDLIDGLKVLVIPALKSCSAPHTKSSVTRRADTKYRHPTFTSGCV
jgi:hypothetical protein